MHFLCYSLSNFQYSTMTCKTICAAAIGFSMDDYLIEKLSINKISRYNWKKIVPPSDTSNIGHEEDAQITNVINSIVTDKEITVVFLTSRYLCEAAKLMETGKHVRVV
jgi:hypothetical protein